MRLRPIHDIFVGAEAVGIAFAVAVRVLFNKCLSGLLNILEGAGGRQLQPVHPILTDPQQHRRIRIDRHIRQAVQPAAAGSIVQRLASG
ncbi:hypothetical protein D3C72_2104140 [compost metagenome]